MIFKVTTRSVLVSFQFRCETSFLLSQFCSYCLAVTQSVVVKKYIYTVKTLKYNFVVLVSYFSQVFLFSATLCFNYYSSAINIVLFFFKKLI